MNGQDLVENVSQLAMPAPVWFVQFFKALGFALHAVPMNLWYAGLLVALLLRLSRNPHARHFAGRLMRQMPVIVAVGVNLGIVPLLFVQLAYYSVFYPATILMAWFWLAIIVLLIPAYYGVYLYAGGLRGEGGEGRGEREEGMPGATGLPSATPDLASSANDPGGEDIPEDRGGADIPVCRGSCDVPASQDRLALWRVAAGWCAAALFVAIGFLFANGWSLMEHVDRWPDLWHAHSTAGAALGTALNTGDPTLWPRWLMMFGLALGTTAAWVVFDAEWFAGKTVDESYRRWAWRSARRLSSVSTLWFAAAGTWYVFGTWMPELRREMFSGPLVALTAAAALAPGLPWLLLMLFAAGSLRRPMRANAALVALAQFGVLGINAVSRQVVQNLDLKGYLDVTDQRVAVQWGPMAMFLVAFVLGLALVAWMIAQAANSHRLPPGPTEAAARA